MTFFKWVIKSLIHYRRMHIAVASAAAAATAALTGALLTGDSVRATLKYALDSRLGNTGWAVSSMERFFSDGLSRRLEEENILNAPVLRLKGMVTGGDGSIRVNQVRVIGVDDRFFKLSLAGKSPDGFMTGSALVNNALAARLKITGGDLKEIILRTDNPAAISRNLVLAPFKDNTVSIRVPVSGIADDMHFGKFSLEANQQEPLNLFVPLAWLQKQIGRKGRANLMITGNSQEISYDTVRKALKKSWSLEDAEIELVPAGDGSSIELRSSRVFIDQAVTGAALSARPDALPVLTYFVNELTSGKFSTPYSMVTAAESKGGLASVLPPDMKDDEIIINRWLADDLRVKAGDLLTLKYYAPGEWQALKEVKRSFKIAGIVPIEGAVSDPNLTPLLPGLSDSENCSEWDPSLPVDLDRIRDKDETYWDNYRGTPKAFVTLSAGREMWANTYGDLTSIRFDSAPSGIEDLEEELRKHIDPEKQGLLLMPVREKGIKASRGGTDFGQLFLGLSMFLIFSGILLTWLLFVFSIEGRRNQTGMLMATGFPIKMIRRIYLLEGLPVALAGAVTGTLGGMLYTRILVWGLSNAWKGAVAGMNVIYSVSPGSLAAGLISGFLIAVAAMIRTLHQQMKASPHALLSGNEPPLIKSPAGRRSFSAPWIFSIISAVSAIILVVTGRSYGSSAMAGAFFGAGILLLLSIMTWIRMYLIFTGTRANGFLSSVSSLAARNTSRRRGRSMAVIAMLACGVFMVVAVSANRKDPGAGSEKSSSGTGGFSLYAESSVPVVQNLNTGKGRDAWGLDSTILEGTNFTGLRVRTGDDASCLNLNRAQEPRILGVSPGGLAVKGAFSFQETDNPDYGDSPWNLLEQDHGDRIIPAIGDYPTVFWGLGKKTGDILVYRDRYGNEIKLYIAGMIKSSILQGSLLISDRAMAEYFPEVEGYQAWLINTPADKRKSVSEHLTKRLTDAGLSVETSVDRLELFGRMEDTYLSIFLILGGLGLIIGCIGLGLTVTRNILERQGELAMMRAVGFSRKTILKMVCREHISLLIAGILTGMICALVSVAPAIMAASGYLPFGLIALITVMTGLSGIIWVVAATGITLRGNILASLRKE